MGDTTKIQWCDFTWNPWRGCTKVSPGCTNCYAEKLVTTRLGGQWGKGKPRTRASDKIQKDPFKWNKQCWVCDSCGTGWPEKPSICPAFVPDYHGEKSCGGTTFHRGRVFLGSLMDILDDEVPVEWFACAMHAVKLCEKLDFLLVTKRPELFLKRVEGAMVWHAKHGNNACAGWLADWRRGEAPKNVWMITSTENQEQLEKRAPHLMDIPAVVRGLSCEPLLGPLDLDKAGVIWNDSITKMGVPAPAGFNGIDWVIAGGESGPKARPCQVEWLHSIQNQCEAAGVAYFCKQFGSDARQDLSAAIPEADINDPNLDAADIAAWEAHRHSAPLHLPDKKGGNLHEWPDPKMRVRQWPEVNRG